MTFFYRDKKLCRKQAVGLGITVLSAFLLLLGLKCGYNHGMSGAFLHVKAESRHIVADGFYYQKITDEMKEKMTGVSYPESGAVISLSELRMVTVRYYNFKGKVKSGILITNKKIAKKTAKVFYELYQIKYPIQKIKTVDEYGADDVKSMEDNNTSCFNYRVIAGTKKLSEHGKGLAIDINPRINPWVKGNLVSPKNGKAYKERNVKKCKGKYKKYMIHKNDKAYKIFKKYGFSWGGDWKTLKDYQHFEY